MTQPDLNIDDHDAIASDSPASDPDPFSTSALQQIYKATPSTSLPAHINDSSLPQPAPLFGSLTGYQVNYRNQIINGRIASINSHIGRPLSPLEQQAIAWHSAKGFAIASWGPILGLATGIGRWYMTRGEMRWMWLGKLHDPSLNQAWKQYYQEAGPKPKAGIRWDAGRLWSGEVEMLKAWEPARKEALLQVLRSGPYIGLGFLCGVTIFSGYAATVTAVGEVRDQRLRAMEKQIAEVVQRKMKIVRERQGGLPRAPDGQSSEREEPTSHGHSAPSEAWKTRREAIEKGYDAIAQNEDASPTNSDDFFGEIVVDERSRTMSNNTHSRPQRQGGYQRVTKEDPFQTSDQQINFQQDRYEKQTPASDSSFDDASPTGGVGATGNNDTSGAPGGSVWERIRHDAAASGPSSQSPNPAEQQRMRRDVGEGGGFPQSQARSRQVRNEEDGFGSSASEEGKLYARDEAQRDFDARVEKERVGGDFDGGRKW